MKSCITTRCLLLSMFISCISEPISVRVKQHDTAVLPCYSQNCSSVVWRLTKDYFHILAQCNQTSCQLKEGYNISNIQFLKGNYSLIILNADKGDRMLYTCECNGTLVATIQLHVEGQGPPIVKVECHGSVTLPCNDNCSGLVTWNRKRKPDHVLAQCNQTSCRAEQGYNMSHDLYLNGNLSLHILNADFSRRGIYTCRCDGMSIIDIHLRINPLNSSVHIESNDSLILPLDIPDPVEVLYNSTGSADPSSVQICTVEGCSPACKPEYTLRVSPALKVTGATKSDSGVYTIRDSENKENIHIVTVTVRDEPPCHDGDKGVIMVPFWVSVSSLTVNGILLLFGVVLLVRCVKKRTWRI